MASKRSILSKSKEIESKEELLEILDSKVVFETYPGFSAYFRLTSSEGAELRAEVGREKLRLQVRPILHPTRRLLREARLGKFELLACPHIAEPLALDLRREGLAHADANGRLFLSPEAGVVDLRPASAVYRSPRRGPAPFSPKATRIIRHLLCHRSSSLSQAELAKQTGASRALVSQVLKQLLDDELVEQLSKSSPENPAYYRLTDFDRLLDAWKGKDRWQERTTVHEYSVLSSNPQDIARKLVDSVGAGNLAFTQWFAAWQRRPHTTPPVVSCYIKKRRILEIVPARRVKSGGNLWLIVPEDEGVWQEAQATGGFPLVSDVQIYLDLLQVDQRGPETAAELRAWEGFAR